MEAFSGVMEDPEGFLVVYRREREVLLSFVARRTFDGAVAADITAETFALALRAWGRLRGRAEEEVRAWLFTVARRQISRFLRRATVERRAIQRLGMQLPAVGKDEVEEIERRAGLAELRCSLGRELAQLSAEQRDAVQLRVVEERSYEAVATELGISEQAARARVSRGLRALSRALGPQWSSEEVRQ